jgi:hypothetical protein
MTQTGGLVILYAWLIFAGLLIILAYLLLRHEQDPLQDLSRPGPDDGDVPAGPKPTQASPEDTSNAGQAARLGSAPQMPFGRLNVRLGLGVAQLPVVVVDAIGFPVAFTGRAGKDVAVRQALDGTSTSPESGAAKTVSSRVRR